jgi:hypothetical protein
MPSADLPDTEILVGRMVDREGDPADEARFRALAGARPELWCTLAERLMDMASLGAQFEHAAGPALDIELPVDRGGRRPGPWLVSFAGWAALVVVALSWAVIAMRGPAPDHGTPLPTDGNALAGWTPDDHFRAYVDAPNVIAELEPTVLEVEERPDGRLEVRYLRRIEETALIAAGLRGTVVTPDRRLAVPPESLRGTVIERPRQD